MLYGAPSRRRVRRSVLHSYAAGRRSGGTGNLWQRTKIRPTARTSRTSPGGWPAAAGRRSPVA